MKKILYISALFSLFSCENNSSSIQSLSDSPFQYKKNEHSLLWEISGNGLETPSYLFGTIHIINEEDYFFGESIDSALANCEQLITEINLTKLAQSNVINFFKLPENQNLSMLLQPEMIDSISSVMEISPEQFVTSYGDFKPSFILQRVVLSLFGENTKSYEMELFAKATQYNISLNGLESLEYQASLFDSVPLTEQVQWITQYLSNPEKTKETLTALIQSYKNEDLSTMQKIFKESPEMKDYQELFITDRNKNWIPIIEENIKKKSSFIAVGAGHLSGKKGVINLLRTEGYVLKPLETR